MLLALDLENLPPIPGAALPWIFAALFVLWLALRVWIARSHARSGGSGSGEAPAEGRLAALARRPLVLPALLLVLVALIAAAWLAWR